jgi:hypothetical protein
MAFVDPIHVAWKAINPRVPVPPELNVGPATVENPQPDPVRAARTREYQRHYQRRLRRSKKS